MAVGRSIGNIEVSVHPDTKRLQAQMTPEGRKAGKQLATAMNLELKDLKAEIGKVDGKKEAQILRKQIEAALRGIPIDIDVGDASRTLAEWREREQVNDVLIGLALDEGDTAKLAAQVNAMTEDQRDIIFHSELDTTELQAEMARQRAKDITIDLLARLDDRNLQKELAEMRAKVLADREAVKLKATIDLARLDAELKEATRQRRFKLDGTVDLAEAQLGIDRFIFRNSREQVDLKVGAEIKEAVAAVETLKKQLDGKQIDMTVDANMLKARATIAAFRELQERDDIDIPTNIDIDVLEAQLSKAGGRFATAGGDVGDSFGAGLSEHMKLIAGAIVLAFEPAIVAIEGLAGGAVAVAGSAFAALASAAAAAVPIFLAFGAAVTGVVVGLAGVPDAISAVNAGFAEAAKNGTDFTIFTDKIIKSLSGLTPAARDFVIAFAEIRQQFADVQATTQEALFEGLGDSLRLLSSRLLPDVQAALASMAGAVNVFARGLSGDLSRVNLGEMFQNVRPAIDNLLTGLRNLVKAVAPFFEAATPAAIELSESFKDATASLQALIETGNRTGGLNDWLLEGVESLREWGGLIREVTEALGLLLSAGRDTGDSLVSSLTDIIEKFNEWMRSVEGQDALGDFFAKSVEIIKGLQPLIEGVAEALGGLFNDDAISSANELSVSLGELAIQLGEMFAAVSQAGVLQTTVELLVAAFQALDAVLEVVPAPLIEIVGAVYVLNKAMGAMTDVFVKVGVKIAEFAGNLAGLGGSAGPLAAVGLAVGLLTAAWVANQQEVAKLKRETQEYLDVLTQFSGSAQHVELVNTIFENLTDESIDTRKALLQFGITAEGIATKLEAGAAATDLAGEALRRLGPDFRFLAEGIENGTVSLDTLIDDLRVGFPSDSPIAKRLKELGISGDTLANVLEALSDETNEYGRAAEDAALRGKELAAGMPISEIEGTTKAFAIFAAELRAAAPAAADFREEARLIEQLDPEPMDELRNFVSGAGDAMDRAAKDADNMRTALDKLLDPTLSEQEALDQLAANVDDLAKSFEENGKTLDANTEAGRKNREAIRTSIEGFKDYAETAKATGKSNEEISAGLEMLRGQLINDIAPAFADGAVGAENYINQLGLTPTSIETLISTPGMLEAFIATGDLNSALTGLPDQVSPKVDTSSWGTAFTDTENLKNSLKNIDGVKASPTMSIDDDIAIADLGNLNNDLSTLDALTVEPTVELDDTQAVADLGNLNNTLNNLDGRTVSASVLINGRGLFNALGGYAQEGFTNIAGEAGPEWATFRNGSKTLLEQATIVPAGTLLRPAQQAELPGTQGGSFGKQVNVEMNVYPQAADPQAVASSLVNRVAALANR